MNLEDQLREAFLALHDDPGPAQYAECAANLVAHDLDTMISIIEQEYPQEDDRWQLANAARQRWFPTTIRKHHGT